MLPTDGFSDHVTPMFVVPDTEAVNCWVWEEVKVALPGFIETDTTPGGFNVTVAWADLVASAEEVAVTVTCCVVVIEEGAVYSPEPEMLPTDGLNDHVTAVFVVPDTEAANCWVWDAVKVALPGVTDTDTGGGGFSATAIWADLVGSAAAVAFTVTCCEDVIEEGAVYSPEPEMLPRAGLNDHATAVFVVPVTEAVNCCVWEANNVAPPGVKDTDTVGGAGCVTAFSVTIA